MGFTVLPLTPDAEHLHGATLAQTHLARLRSELANPCLGPTILVLDLSKAVSITASYLRATAYWALLCGQTYAKESSQPTALEPWAVRALPLFPVVTKGSTELMADVDDFFRSRSLPILVVPRIPSGEIKEARLLGQIDPVLANTLQTLASRCEATAKDLWNNSTESITANGWSNRLADLHLLRLVTRRREGKFWHYSPIAKSIKPWA